MGEKEFRRYDGTNFFATDIQAHAADGAKLSVLGTGRVTFALWGRVFQNMPVKVMSNLPSGVLLGNKFIVAGLGLWADFEAGWGSFLLPIASGEQRLYQGRITRDDVLGDSEETSVIADTDVDGMIAALDLAELGTNRSKRRFGPSCKSTGNFLKLEVFIPTTVVGPTATTVTAVAVGPDFTIRLKPDADTGKVFCPPFRQTRRKRDRKE